ncbi:two-component system sensor histidine kinase PhcS [Paraburkholderia bannensis]|uniref:histidine kinase n=1 Tax=Paraburkholderia bannensis TaxID=765414 RepID=A0A7W9TXR3_9BURK|nr:MULTISPECIES: ATP-binding protein [Paraburkholderia]MBB3258315.1 two-component system sensor histidine kinase PhcS [Paraburkholderia sp. WP4_3_2]MBB6103328.1 two-component system sensor histidine kinase PhcS [Paraburkholderia bannensis]
MTTSLVGLQSTYREELRDYRLLCSKAGGLTVIVLVLMGAAMDYVVYPAEQKGFALLRGLTSIAIALALLSLYTETGKRHVQVITFLWLLLPQAMISWMIYATQGEQSLFYAGLTLTIFAVGILFASGYWQTLAFGVVTVAFYYLACTAHPGGISDPAKFQFQLILIFFCALASSVYTFFNEKGRFQLFRLKDEIAHKNEQLARSNESLAQIKGQLLQQEKMAAIGTLSAGLLHEVNNPVNFCLMAIEIAMEEPLVKDSASLQECLTDAKQGMQRIQHIVSDLKTFAYRKPGATSEDVPFLFEKALDSSIRLDAHELRGVKLTRELPVDTLVLGDEAAIVGVLINLFSNAALAMQKAGTASPQVHVKAHWQDGRLHVNVRDNGPGIAPENLARVFEPFFTTREVGQGLGLGLSISYAVVEQHGGTLFAESQLGEWTAFNFDLPRAE